MKCALFNYLLKIVLSLQCVFYTMCGFVRGGIGNLIHFVVCGFIIYYIENVWNRWGLRMAKMDRKLYYMSIDSPCKEYTGFIQLYESYYRVLISRVVQAILLTFYSRCGMSIQLCNVKHIRVDSCTSECEGSTIIWYLDEI